MKKLLAIATLSLFAQFGMAQAPLCVDCIQANAGIGFDGKDGDIPVYVGADYGVKQNWTVGARGSINGKEYPFAIAANVNYHLNEVLALPDEWNVYGGGNLGWVDRHNDDGKVEAGLQVGARYFFKQSNWGANLEFGGGTERTGGRLGVTYKF